MAIKLGLIGVGRIGKVFAHTLAFNVPQADLVAVAEERHLASDRDDLKPHYEEAASSS